MILSVRRPQFFISHTRSQRLLVTQHRLSCENANLHNTLCQPPTCSFTLPLKVQKLRGIVWLHVSYGEEKVKLSCSLPFLLCSPGTCSRLTHRSTETRKPSTVWYSRQCLTFTWPLHKQNALNPNQLEDSLFCH